MGIKYLYIMHTSNIPYRIPYISRSVLSTEYLFSGENFITGFGNYFNSLVNFFICQLAIDTNTYTEREEISW